jgi:uncharacterized protein YcbK (DUF882 family)
MKHALVVAVLGILAGRAAADDTALAPVAKKDRARASKSTKNLRPLPVPGAKPGKLVNLYNTWTHEWLAIASDQLPPATLRDRFFRDHYTNEPTTTEPKLVDIVLAAAAEFRADTIMIVSAFRHPKYNLILRKKGHQVARDSNHTKGNAVDFYIPRVATKRLHEWAKAQKLGGVGLYTGSGFIHMDTGNVRYWTGE